MIPWYQRGEGGGPQRAVEMVLWYQRGGGGGPKRGAEMVPWYQRGGGGGSLEGCRDGTMVLRRWVGDCFAKNLRKGG